MLSPDAFREQHSVEELEAGLPNSLIGSLCDLQCTYGKLYTPATTDGDEYAPYITLNEADGPIDTDHDS